MQRIPIGEVTLEIMQAFVITRRFPLQIPKEEQNKNRLKGGSKRVVGVLLLLTLMRKWKIGNEANVIVAILHLLSAITQLRATTKERSTAPIAIIPGSQLWHTTSYEVKQKNTLTGSIGRAFLDKKLLAVQIGKKTKNTIQYAPMKVVASVVSSVVK
eukprot:scaffold4847_cov89-Cylindrotheca_fusiformis.AAC.4